MLFFAYAGIFPLYFGWDEYRYYMGVQNKEVILKMFACSSWTIVTMVLGFNFCRHILNFRFYLVSTGLRSFTCREKIITFTLFSVCLIVLAVYLSKLPSIALFVVMNKLGTDEIGAARSLMGNDFAGKLHWYNLFMRDALNVVTFAFFANWLVKKGKINFIFFLLSALAASFSAIMATEKGPFAWFLIGLFLVHVFVVSRGVYPIKSIVKLAFCLLSFLVVFYLNFMGSTEIGSALLSVLSRAITGGIDPAYFYLEHFPKSEDFLLGQSLPNPGGLLPFTPYPLTKEASLWMIPDNALKGIVGSAPTVFWAELYANWGMYGVLLIPFIIGIGLYSISAFVNKLECNPLKVGLMVWLALHLKNLSESGISEFLVDTSLTVILALVLLMTFLANKCRFKIKGYNWGTY